MGTARNHASKSLLWSSVDTFSQMGFSIVALVLLARTLSAEDIGIGSLAIMIVQLATMPFEQLFHDSIVQHKQLTSVHLTTAFTATVLGACGGALILIAAAPWIAARYDKPPLAMLLQVAAIAIPVSGAAIIISANLRRQLAFAPLARRTVIGRIIGVIIGLVVAWSGGGAWALVSMYVASIVLSTMVLLIDRHHVPGWGLNLVALRELLRFGVPSMLSQVLLLGNARIFVTMAGFYLTDVALGVLSLAFRVVEELRNTLSSAAAQLALPLLAKRVHAPDQFSSVFAEATCFTAIVLLPFYACVALTAPDLMPTVFGMQWESATGAVTLLSIAAMIVTFRQYSSIAINASGHPTVNLVINGIALLFSVGMLLGNSITDAESAARVWLWRAMVLIIVSLLGTRAATSLSIRTQLAPTLTPFLATLVMCAGSLLLRDIELRIDNTALRLSINIIAAIIIYATTLLAIAPQLFNKLYSFSRHALTTSTVSHQ